jgi:hypothetical protein
MSEGRILLKFIVGRRVVKEGEESRFEGEVVASFVKRNDKTVVTSSRTMTVCCTVRANSKLPEALDPLGQRLRTSAESRVHGRFVSAHRVVAGHDAFGQGPLRSARKPATESEKLPLSTQTSARCFAQVSRSSRLLR